MNSDQVDELIRRESELGQAPAWLLLALSQAKGTLAKSEAESDVESDDDFPEFIYPH